MRGKDLTGQRFGRLVVVEKLPSKNKRCWWRCKCDCGNFKDVPTTYLTLGNTRSCGCLAKENSIKYGKINNKKAIQAHTSHKLSHTKEYGVWKAMIYRVTNPNDPNYHNYGGRGIKICKEWEDVKNFYEWCCKSGYKEGLELDRIDVNGNYEPSNCKWATRKEQCNNMRRNIRVEINGVSHTLSEWAEITGIRVNALQHRYHKGARGEELIRKVNSSNTGIMGISKNKCGTFKVDITHKGERRIATTKTLEEAIAKKEEIIKSIEGGNLNV